MLATTRLCPEKVFTDISVIATFEFIGCHENKSFATRSTLSHTDIASIWVNIEADHVNFMTNPAIADSASFG
jgi:hypothetical protein